MNFRIETTINEKDFVQIRKEFNIDELIEEDINYYINEEDPYINKAVEYLNSKINKFVN